MPRRILMWSREEPARSILFVVSLLTALAQIAGLAIAGFAGAPTAVVVIAVGIWAMTSAAKDNLRHMALSAFWVFFLWLFTGLSMLVFVPNPATLLWVPFIVVASTMGIVYIYLNAERRRRG